MIAETLSPSTLAPIAAASSSSTATIPTTTTATATSLTPPRHPELLQEDPQTVLRETEAHDRIEDATLPGSLPSLRKQYITFSKAPSSSNELPSRISRIWYINPYGHEIYPLANPKVLSSIAHSNTVIYSIGSLYTSLVPSLILRGVGNAISSSAARRKILILNSTLDRETGPGAHALTATDFVRAVARACEGSRGRLPATHQAEHARALGTGAGEGRKVESEGAGASDDDHDDDAVRKYVTHLVYLEGEGVPKVDRAELSALGVDCVRVYGRRVGGMLRYDEAGLEGALEAIVGKAEMARSRRNTSGQ